MKINYELDLNTFHEWDEAKERLAELKKFVDLQAIYHDECIEYECIGCAD